MEPSFSDLSSMLSHLTEGEVLEVERAFHFAVKAHASQSREDGTPYVYHVIEVAKILAGWKADADTIIAALLHDTIEDTGVTKEGLSSLFGRHVALLVDSVTKFTDADLSPNLPLDRKIETLRKLFDVMRLDVRSILIKLADRIHNIRTIHFLPTPERRRRFAEETLEVYYKIAVHLGMREVRHIFAEYAVPEAYDDGNQVCAEWWSFLDEAATISRTMLEAIRGTGVQPLSVAAEARNLSAFYDRRRRRGRRGHPRSRRERGRLGVAARRSGRGRDRDAGDSAPRTTPSPSGGGCPGAHTAQGASHGRVPPRTRDRRRELRRRRARGRDRRARRTTAGGGPGEIVRAHV